MKVTFKIANKELPMPLAVTVGGEEKVVYDKKDVTEFDLEEKQTKLTVEVKKEKYLDEAKKSKNIFVRAILFLLYPLFAICGFSCNAILKLNCIKDLDNCFAESIPFKQKFSFSIEPTDTVDIVYKAPKYNGKLKRFSAAEIDLQGATVLDKEEKVEFDRSELKKTCVYNTASVVCLMVILIVALNILAFFFLMGMIDPLNDFSVWEKILKIGFSVLFLVLTLGLYALPALTILRLKKHYSKIVENETNKKSG